MTNGLSKTKTGTEQSGRAASRSFKLGVSERLLLFTLGFVMLAEVLIYVPSIAIFRNSWLNDRLAAARTAALVLEAAPPDSMPDTTIQQLLQTLQAKTITIKIGGARRLLGFSDMPPMVDRQFDLRSPTIVMSIMESFETLVYRGNRTVNVMGPAPMGGEFIDIVIDEKPLFDAMVQYSVNILLVSLIISGITGLLVYLTLHRMIVRPVSRLVSSITEFAGNPEDQANIIRLSGRSDEIGRAEEALHGMQTTLSSQLLQKQRLASLGLAVSKINHDLRNMLASVQLFSDRLADIPDPTVQRFAPKLMAALDRAIHFCQSTLTFGKAQEAAPSPRRVDLVPLLNEVRETLGAGPDNPGGVKWIVSIPAEFQVTADPDHLFRILVNLGRNAMQALAGAQISEIRIQAQNGGGSAQIEIADNGPGVPASMQTRLFEAFNGSGRPGSTGLGLAIAADLVRAHGGKIELVTYPGQTGACFRIILPQAA